MKNNRLKLALLALCISASSPAQDIRLHVDPTWEECAFRLDRSLTLAAWRQFTKEAALVTYFRPLTDARPMGKGAVEIAVLKWETAINESHDAWNNTFVHPDSVHWLVGGPRLGFPGLTARVGLTPRIDAGIYFTRSFGANYGFIGGQVQYNFLDRPETGWAASARASLVSMFGPEDVKANNGGIDLIASRRFNILSDWCSVSPYASVSAYLSHASERSDVVDLRDEYIPGLQAAAGAVLRLSVVRLGVEYNVAKISTFSYKIGLAYKFGTKA